MSRFLALAVGIVSLLVLCTPASATVDRFDEVTMLSEAGIIDGYGGFDWQNFWVLNATTFVANPSGFLNGLVSPDYVAFNAWGEPAQFSGDPFNFIGVYLTAAWRDGLNVDVEGYRDGLLVYRETVVLDTSAPLWFQADYVNVDTVRFVSYGGTHHQGLRGDGTQFALDNLTHVAIPAPGAVLLVGLGTTLTGWLRRRSMI